MIPTDIGDPASYAMPSNPNFFATNLPGGLGTLVVQNDTPYSVDIGTNDGGPFRVPSGWARAILVKTVCNTATWAVVTSISPASSLVSDLYVEAYGLDEELPETYPSQIIRQVAIGNQVNTNQQNVIVAQVINSQQATAGAITVLTYTPTGVSAFLRLNVAFKNGNATASPKPRFTLTYTDPDGTAQSITLIALSAPGGAVTWQHLDGTNVFGGLGSWLPMLPFDFRAKAGSLISLVYQDASWTSGTSNINAALELLVQS